MLPVIKSKEVQIELLSEAIVKNPNNGNRTKTYAKWDTGATQSCITERLAKLLGLSKSEKQKTIFFDGNMVERSTYEVLIKIGDYWINPLVVEINENDRFGFIVGMDVISLGDFTVSTFDSMTTFCFRMPSKGHIELD